MTAPITEVEQEFMVDVLDEKIIKMETQLADVKALRAKLISGNGQGLDRRSLRRGRPRSSSRKQEASSRKGSTAGEGNGGSPPPASSQLKKNRLKLLKAAGKKKSPSQIKTPSKKYKNVELLGNGKFMASVNIEKVQTRRTFDSEEEAAEWAAENKGLRSIEELLKNE